MFLSISGGCERQRILQLCGGQHPGGEREHRLPGDKQDQQPGALAPADGPLLTAPGLPAYQGSQHSSIMTDTLRPVATRNIKVLSNLVRPSEWLH